MTPTNDNAPAGTEARRQEQLQRDKSLADEAEVVNLGGPVERILRALTSRGCNPRRNGSGWSARCPAHPDRNPSLSIGEAQDGKALLTCHAGCGFESILAALDLIPSDLFADGLPPARRNGKPPARKRKIVATYDYVSESGELLYQTVRYEPKGFAQRRPDGRGGWVWNLKDVPLVLYQLPKVRRAIAEERTVYLAEGEKDCDNLHRLGLVGTCNPMGAGKWRPEFTESLRGAHMVILPDNDAPGRKHAETVARSLQGIPAEVKVLHLPGLPEKGDVSDWIAAGGTCAELERLAAEAPVWRPSDEVELAHGNRTHTNKQIKDRDVLNEQDNVSAAFALTDLGNAERFAAQHGADVRFCHPWNTWLVFDGVAWKEDRTGEVYRRATETIRGIYQEAAREPDPERRKLLAAHAKRSESRHSIENMISIAEFQPGIPILPEALDNNPHHFALVNGVYDLQADCFREARHEDYISRTSPVSYDPHTGCPTWTNFLETVMSCNQNIIKFLQRVAGYSLSGLATEQMLFLLHGSGANGKSTFLNALLHVWGDYGVRLAGDLLIIKHGETHPTGLADLFKRRLAVASESESGKRLAEALVKELTGGERIKARRMRQDFFEFDPTHKVFFCTNHKPVITGTDYAIWRRIALIPFEVTIPPDEQDKDLAAKLRAEASGILNWCIAGFREWRRVGLAPPEEVLQATNDYRSDMDILSAFLDDRCIQSPHARVRSSALRKSYEIWCSENGEHAMGGRTFQNRLKERGFHSEKGGITNDRYWVGIGLLTEGSTD